MLHLFVNGIPVFECPLVESFKQFLCNAIGEIGHCPGTTLTANGSLTLSSFLSQRMLDIDFNYAEFPSIVGSSDGCCKVTIPLFEFLAIHKKGG
jgi:hypothetical protein